MPTAIHRVQLSAAGRDPEALRLEAFQLDAFWLEAFWLDALRLLEMSFTQRFGQPALDLSPSSI